jgi:protein-disulfide isomerase
MKRECLHFFAAVFLAFVYFPLVAQGTERRCSGLDSVTIAECGNQSISKCGNKSPANALVRRLDLFIRWIDTVRSDDIPCSTRVAALKERYAGFKDLRTYPIDTAGVAFAGYADAPVTLVAYVTASCPLCKRVYRELYREVTKGTLRRVAKLGIKVFSDKPKDVALLAAGRFNRTSDLLLSLADVEERISMRIIFQKAHEIGLPDSAFKALLQDSGLIKKTRASVLEGEKNGVSVTPTVFINGKRYHSYKDPQWIVDAVLCEHETGGEKTSKKPR